MPRASDPQTDRLALAVGYALAAWASVENMLSFLFDELTDANHIDSQIMMASIVTFDARVAICTNLINRHFEDDEVLRMIWTKLSEKLLSSYRSRHQIAHFSFVASSCNKLRVVRLVPFFSFGNIHLGKNQDGLGISEIEDKENRFLELGSSVLWFKETILCRRVPSLRSPPQDTSQVSLIRSLVVQKLANKAPQPQSSPP